MEVVSREDPESVKGELLVLTVVQEMLSKQELVELTLVQVVTLSAFTLRLTIFIQKCLLFCIAISCQSKAESKTFEGYFPFTI